MLLVGIIGHGSLIHELSRSCALLIWRKASLNTCFSIDIYRGTYNVQNQNSFSSLVLFFLKRATQTPEFILGVSRAAGRAIVASPRGGGLAI
jgi:hypothetical protein